MSPSEPAHPGYKPPPRPSSLGATHTAADDVPLPNSFEGRPSSVPATRDSWFTDPESHHSTPRSVNNNVNPATATMPRQRDVDIANMADRVIEVEMDFYTESVLRPMTDAELDAIEKRLIKEGVLVVDLETGSYGWKSFPRTPSKMPGPPRVSEKASKANTTKTKTTKAKASKAKATIMVARIRKGAKTSRARQTRTPATTSAKSKTAKKEEAKKQKQDTKEDYVFSNMRTLYADVIRVAADALGLDESKSSVSALVNEPRIASWSPLRLGHFQPDGFLTRRESVDPRPSDHKDRASQPYAVVDHVDLQEYKLSTSIEDFNDNTLKLIGNASHVLWADPGREFMFGVTIMNANTRLWFFSRTHSLATEEFNFIKEPRHLIRYIVSLAFSSYEMLGYDKTVTGRHLVTKPVIPGGPKTIETMQYTYKVEERFFRTEEDINTIRAGVIVSRASRILAVMEVNKEGEPAIERDDQGNPIREKDGTPRVKRFVLKDIWTSASAPTEGQILKLVRESLCKVHPELFPDSPPGEDPLETFKKRFLTVEAEDIVSRSTAYTRQKLLPEGQLYGLELKRVQEGYLREPAGSQGKPSARGWVEPGGLTEPPEKTVFIQARRLNRDEFEHKYHVRTVFQQRGKDLYKREDLEQFFQAVADTGDALGCMSSAGWVHCDPSPGNTLLMPEGCARLSDLEFARPFLDSDVTRRARKTGTAYFMACEVLEHRYLFRKNNPPPVLPSGPNSSEVVTTLSRRKKPFLHNYLHDVESLWWMCVYYLSKLPNTNETNYDAIFRNKAILSSDRRALFMIQDVFMETMENLLPNATANATAASAIKRIVARLEGARLALVHGYETLEAIHDFPCEPGPSEATEDTVEGDPRILAAKLFTDTIPPVINSIRACVPDAHIVSEYLQSIGHKLWSTNGKKRKYSESLDEVQSDLATGLDAGGDSAVDLDHEMQSASSQGDSNEDMEGLKSDGDIEEDKEDKEDGEDEEDEKEVAERPRQRRRK